MSFLKQKTETKKNVLFGKPNSKWHLSGTMIVHKAKLQLMIGDQELGSYFVTLLLLLFQPM
jgi:hypothetical protein